MTSATIESSSPKYSLFPMRIFRAGSTNTSHKRFSSFNSRNKNTSIFAPVFSLFPYNLAGKTFVSLKTKTSLSSKYSSISLNIRCSISPVLRCTTIKRDSSLFFAGYLAICSSVSLNLNCDNFICISILFPKKHCPILRGHHFMPEYSTLFLLYYQLL